MLSLRQLQQFLAVTETMSFRRAAERLNMAQPPLTSAIRQMEEELGVRLLERTNRIIALTEAGRVLREEARRTLAQAARAETLTRRAGQGISGSLRIGFVASAVRHLLPELVVRFRRSHPEVLLDLTEMPTGRQTEALLEDRLDIGIVVLPLPSNADKLIATHVVLKSQLVAALPKQHALASKSAKPLPLAALAHEPWILFPGHEGPGLQAGILAACAEAGFAPQVAQRAVQMETILGLVAAELGVALVPALFGVTGWDRVAFRPLRGPGTPIDYRLALAWRKNDSSAALAAFLTSAGAHRSARPRR
ncbi:DNA-binding transcriptional regulator, LysR family [Enhydrobacter aerosaccus]|uniref:DNA-binding transcriptional regulator, LysR family n=1 Tax=Enhydrobacter aerosaccus TaxID=225324 RepID=A0A1T4MTX2_9HYPH|nr:LysR family transcriptional regulator [Enhydrobacter aerosaccus]SJZ70078.1 DNA-binding transcriptional regulator, LysR family [Enhydrobacter aerosaccus]